MLEHKSWDKGGCWHSKRGVRTAGVRTGGSGVRTGVSGVRTGVGTGVIIKRRKTVHGRNFERM